MKIYSVSILIAGVTAAWMARAAEMSAPSGPAPVSTIAGMVRDAAGAPVAGVPVFFNPGSYPGSGIRTEATTDQNGRYELVVRREAIGIYMGPIIRTNFVLARDPERNLAAIAEFDAFPTNLDLVLQPGITLSGVVKDTEGAPIPTATVELRIVSGSMARVFEKPVSVDAQGAFSIPALPQGQQYNFFNGITAKGYGTAGGWLKAADSKTSRYEFPVFVLKRTDRILAGKVVGRDGKPLAGATVRFNGQGQPEWPSATSDQNGDFRFENVCDGEVQLSAYLNGPPGSGEFMSAGDGAGIKAHAGDTGIVLTLRDPNVFDSAPVLRVTGTVLSPSGEPASRVNLAVWRAANPFLITTTDSDGNYKLRWQQFSAPPGTKAPPIKAALVARDINNNLAVTCDLDETMTNLDLQLQPALTLSGFVRDAEGQPVTNAAVGLHMTLNRAGASLGETRTDAQGAFSFRALPTLGDFDVRIDADGFVPAFRLQPRRDSTRSNHLILPTVTLAAASLTLAGKVLGPDGQPASGVWVNLGGIRQPGGNAYTDTDGHFVFKHVGEGSVRVSASPSATADRPAMTGFVQAQGGETNVVLTLQARQ